MVSGFFSFPVVNNLVFKRLRVHPGCHRFGILVLLTAIRKKVSSQQKALELPSVSFR